MTTARETDRLNLLRKLTTVVIDTGEINTIKKYQPQDSTTNPSLIKLASGKAEYRHLLDHAISAARSFKGGGKAQRTAMMDQLFVNFGVEILKYVPGRVSTEVDAHLSFDVAGSIAKARHLIELYKQAGVPRERVLIKLASTWEGVQAAKVLEKEGIHCNMTLMFSLVQAAACFEAGATLISPFVGRILDWHKKNKGVGDVPGDEDPGVLSVRAIYAYLKQHGYKTQIMGASFRNSGEIIALAGCDLLTIAPDLLEELSTSYGAVEQKLSVDWARRQAASPKLAIDEASFRWQLNEDQMATEKLSDGIRRFAADYRDLEEQMAQQL